MAIPAYMWLTDSQGNDISGSVSVVGRVGSIELMEYSHSIYIPSDSDTGALTATRKHGAVNIVKTFDSSSPYLFKACCDGQKLQKAIIRWYNINASGQEEVYYEHVLDAVRVNSFSPGMANTKDPKFEKIPHIEQVAFRYEKITHTFLDGNISYSDSWLEGR